jgi:hypothetical protein
VSTFTQNAGALAAVDADWIIATDFEEQDGTSTADIQYTASNVFAYQDALGLKASAVRVSNLWVPRFIQGIVSTTILAVSRVEKYLPRQACWTSLELPFLTEML